MPEHNTDYATDYGRPLRVFFWILNCEWVNKWSAVKLLTEFVDIVNAACGRNEPCATDSNLVYALAPFVRLAARNNQELLAELRETAQALLVGIQNQRDPMFRLEAMSQECAELCGVAINALYLLHARPEKKIPRKKEWRPRLVQ